MSDPVRSEVEAALAYIIACEVEGVVETDGACPVHGGDNCLARYDRLSTPTEKVTLHDQPCSNCGSSERQTLKCCNVCDHSREVWVVAAGRVQTQEKP